MDNDLINIQHIEMDSLLDMDMDDDLVKKCSDADTGHFSSPSPKKYKNKIKITKKTLEVFETSKLVGLLNESSYYKIVFLYQFNHC